MLFVYHPEEARRASELRLQEAEARRGVPREPGVTLAARQLDLPVWQRLFRRFRSVPQAD